MFRLSALCAFLFILCLSVAVAAQAAPRASKKKPKISAAEDFADKELEAEILKFERESESDPEEDEEDSAQKTPEKPVEPSTGALQGQIPFEFNKRVQVWVNHFSKKDHERFQRYLTRGVPYRNVIEDILEENRVPVELFYLGLIESGFSLNAKSHASAVGVWQFMKPTGKIYGLEINHLVDERRDPIRATEAAAKHLRNLFREFHSWYLALSAYNAGSGRVRQAIRKGGSRNYWVLVKRKALPQETVDYVPKFLAARWIGEHPERYGFDIPTETYPDVELVKVPSPVKLTDIEKVCGIPAGTLAFVNPHFLNGRTIAKGEDEIWVAEPYNKIIRDKYADIAALRTTPFLKAKELRRVDKTPRYVVVQKGDTLSSIAKQSGLSVVYLKKLNNLKRSQVSAGMKLRIAAEGYHRQKKQSQKKKKM